MAPSSPQPLYRVFTPRLHAAKLRWRFDSEGKVARTAKKTRELFVRETPHRAHASRVRSVERADYVARLPCIEVPTLIRTPEEDRMIGRDAVRIPRDGIRGAEEVVMPRTGHMFRVLHPAACPEQIRRFLDAGVAVRGSASSGQVA